MQYYYAIVAVSFVSVACGGKQAIRGGEPGGSYNAELTCVITNVAYENLAKAPAILGAGRGASRTITVSSPTDGSTARVSDSIGCSFLGAVKGRTVAAQNVDCDPFPAESQLARSGVSTRRILAFTLDDNEKRLHQFHLEHLEPNDPSQPDVVPQGFGICEGRIGGGEMPSGQFLVKYRGETLSSVPQPLEIEQAAEPGCDQLVGHDSTDGTLVMKFGADRNELIIYEEGIGCTVKARSTDGIVFNADGSDCVLAETGISQLGAKSRHFDKYSIDFGAKTWTYSSIYVQDRAPDGLRTECLRVTAQIVGELPQ